MSLTQFTPYVFRLTNEVTGHHICYDVGMFPGFKEAMQPIDIPTTAEAVFFCTRPEIEMQIRKARHELAKCIADECYKYVHRMLETGDLHDGYPIKKSNPLT